MIRERRPPDELRICPDCSHHRSPANRSKRVLAVWWREDGRQNTYCHHCGERRSLGKKANGKPRKSFQRPNDNSSAARRLWQQSLAPQGTPVERYLWDVRGLHIPIPPTIRYLPANGSMPHAMISGYGLVEEEEPGLLQTPTSVAAVHRTFLLPDGAGKHDLNKRMLGPVSGKPIVLAPPNDGLGIVITEGIEDALSIHAVTGLGAWSAGSAGQMPKLAEVVPRYVEHVLVVADADEVGQRNGRALTEALLTLNFVAKLKTLGVADG